jgi:hypothetical protein
MLRYRPRKIRSSVYSNEVETLRKLDENRYCGYVNRTDSIHQVIGPDDHSLLCRRKTIITTFSPSARPSYLAASGFITKK